MSQESDITPHGKLVVEVEKMGISVDGKCRTAKAKDRELCGKEKCQTGSGTPQGSVLSQSCFVNDWHSCRSVREKFAEDEGFGNTEKDQNVNQQ